MAANTPAKKDGLAQLAGDQTVRDIESGETMTTLTVQHVQGPDLPTCGPLCRDSRMEHQADELGVTWNHMITIGTAPTQDNDLADPEAPAGAAFEVDVVAADNGHDLSAGLSVEGWAEGASFSLAQARRMRDLWIEAVELLERAS